MEQAETSTNPSPIDSPMTTFSLIDSPTTSASEVSAVSGAPPITSSSESQTVQPTTSSPNSRSTQEPPAAASGVSTGAIAGIASGAVVAGLLLMALLAWLLYKRRHKRTEVADTRPEVPQLDGNPISELGGKGLDPRLGAELYPKAQSEVYEADSQSPAHYVAELAADVSEKCDERDGAVDKRQDREET